MADMVGPLKSEKKPGITTEKNANYSVDTFDRRIAFADWPASSSRTRCNGFRRIQWVT
jgi:hypothetical protein